MAQTSINIRMDADLKKQFDALCNDMGMSMTTAFTILPGKWLENVKCRLRSAGIFRRRSKWKRTVP